jgi:hypothetical protein
MALKANHNILEWLNTPLVEHVTPLAQELLDMRTTFLSKIESGRPTYVIFTLLSFLETPHVVSSKE